MNIKIILGNNGECYLSTLQGEIIGVFGGSVDPEIREISFHESLDTPMTAKIVIETTKIETTEKLVDGSIEASLALPEPLKALPEPMTLPSLTVLSLDT